MKTIPLPTILKLIANPERMAILLQLLDGDRNIAEMSESLSLPATVVSSHLNRLHVTTALSNTAWFPKKRRRFCTRFAIWKTNVRHSVRILSFFPSPCRAAFSGTL